MGATRLVGRDAELARLDTALAEAAEHGGALFVTGAAGIGKTSLLDVAASGARSRGYKVLTVTGRTAKGARTRHLPLNAEALDVLKRWRGEGERKGLVFANPD